MDNLQFSCILDDDGILTEVPFKEMLIHDFSYQGALFFSNANVDKILSAGYWKSKKVHPSFFLISEVFSLPLGYQIIPS